jgi:hypothetical protein
VKVEISFTSKSGQQVRALFRPTVYPTRVDPGDGPELIWAFIDDAPLYEILAEAEEEEAEAVCAALADEAEAAYEDQMASAYAAEDRFSDDDDDGLGYNADQQNDRRGWGSEAPEPCGHHCPSDCPRCGE